MACLLAIVLSICILVLSQGPAVAELGPHDKREALKQQLDETYWFVVRLADGTPLPQSRQTPERVTYPLINGYAEELRVADAIALAAAPQVVQVWYLHPDLAPIYRRVLSGIDYSARTMEPGNVINMSLGPPPAFYVRRPYDDEPMMAAMAAATAAGHVVVVAIGNSGEAGADGYVNPWSFPRTVISVGAWDRKRQKVADFSTRGDPAEPEGWPDVVADGVDAIGAWSGPPKSPERRAYDEANEDFVRLVPKGDWNSFTLMSGSSMATANVAGAVAQIIHFVRCIVERGGGPRNGAIFQMSAPAGRLSTAALGDRLTGTAEIGQDGSVTLTYALDEPWRVAKQLIIDTAYPLPGIPAHVAGAGVVDRLYINEQFGACGLVDTKIMPVKVH